MSKRNREPSAGASSAGPGAQPTAAASDTRQDASVARRQIARLEEENARLRALLHSERERLEQESARRAGQLGAIFEAMVDGVAIYDAQGRIVRLNPAIRRLLALDDDPTYATLSISERVPRLILRDEAGQLLSPDQTPPARVIRGEVLTGAASMDMSAHTLDGRDVELNVSGTPVLDAQGRIVGAVCVYRDVTERRRLERRTHEALAALLAMAEALVRPALPSLELPAAAGGEGAEAVALAQPAGELAELGRRALGCEFLSIVTRDADQRILYPVAIAGVSEEQTRDWWNRWRGGVDIAALMDEAQLAQLHAGHATERTLPAPAYRGTAFGIRTTLVAPLRLDERLVGLISLGYTQAGRTFTEDELALAEAVGQLIALVVQRERLLREREEARANALALAEANRRMDEFLGIAGHEMRTPLTVIKASAQAMRRVRGLAAREARAFERMEYQSNRLARLITDMLEVSRIKTGKLELQRAAGDLLALVHETVDEEREINPGRTISLVIPPGLGEGELCVVMDRDRIGQVLTNYLTNALKYSSPDSRVRVTVERRDGWARVAVRDEGPGIASEEREHVWERFHRVPGIDTQSGSGIGLGLGLYISREIVERHGGTVGVESEVGRGSVFSFGLPLAPDPA